MVNARAEVRARHLGALREAGLITVHRSGRAVRSVRTPAAESLPAAAVSG